MKRYLYLLAGGIVMHTACRQATSTGATAMDTALYLRTGHPDTALAIFLFKECYNYRFHNQREEYVRYEAEYDGISRLYAMLWSQKPDYRDRLKQLEANQEQFLRDARNEVHASYRNHHAISNGMLYSYLLSRKDEELKSLLVKIAADNAAPDEERINAAETLAGW